MTRLALCSGSIPIPHSFQRDRRSIIGIHPYIIPADGFHNRLQAMNMPVQVDPVIAVAAPYLDGKMEQYKLRSSR